MYIFSKLKKNRCFINFNKIYYNFNDVYVKLINLTSMPSLNFGLIHQSQIFQSIPRLSRAVIMKTNAENARGLGRDPPFPQITRVLFSPPYYPRAWYGLAAQRDPPRANGRNIVGSCCDSLQVAKSFTGFKLSDTLDSKQHATTRNRKTKQTKRPFTMLRP